MELRSTYLIHVVVKIPLGAQGVACVRVGNALGAGDTAGAILTSKVILILAGKQNCTFRPLPVFLALMVT